MPAVQPLLRLLEQAHPERDQADLLAMIDALPDRRAAAAPQKPVQRRLGSRARTPASIERRRSWAAAGRMPPRLAARFTLAEVAVLAVVAAEVARHGACTLTIGHIAALAGVGRSTVKRALRQAHGLNLIRIEERRLTAWRNDTNVIRIVSPEWLSWLRLQRRGEGSNLGPARIPVDNQGTSARRRGPRAAGREGSIPGSARRDSGWAGRSG